MPTLNMSEILCDSEMADHFSLVRRVETVNNHGRSTVTQTTYNLVGVITAGDPNNLEREEDRDYSTRSLSVVCKFPVRMVAQNYKSDVIIWRDNQYVVKHVDPYPQFGEGFFQVECESMDKLDSVLDKPQLGRMSGDSLNTINILMGVLPCL